MNIKEPFITAEPVAKTQPRPEHPVVTVLVAVYNTAPYLPRCLDSLCRQTLRDIQVVCVDDASTDGSLDVLRNYARLDARFHVVALSHNQGQAHARNVGLRLAQGTYTCFLDSDDWMSADCLEQAVGVFRQHPQTGCVLFHTLYYYSPSRKEEYPMSSFEVMSGREAFVKSLTWQIHGVYMVLTAIHRRYPYDESAHAFSDDNTTRLHYLASTEVRLCSGTYYYRQRADSVSHAFSMRRFDYLTANLSMRRQLDRLNVGEAVTDIYENHRWLNVIDSYMLWYRHRHELSPEERAHALHLIKTSWQSIEPRRLSWRNRLKPGYMPMHGSWALFRLQEEIYFWLRQRLRKEKY